MPRTVPFPYSSSNKAGTTWVGRARRVRPEQVAWPHRSPDLLLGPSELTAIFLCMQSRMEFKNDARDGLCVDCSGSMCSGPGSWRWHFGVASQRVTLGWWWASQTVGVQAASTTELVLGRPGILSFLTGLALVLATALLHLCLWQKPSTRKSSTRRPAAIRWQNRITQKGLVCQLNG